MGAELIGLDSIAAAREVVGVAVEGLAAAGVAGVSIDFTLPDLVDTLAAGPLPVAPEQIARLRERLDAKDAGGVAAIVHGILPFLFTTTGSRTIQTLHGEIVAKRGDEVQQRSVEFII